MKDEEQAGGTRVRLDKWLWAARLFKTRALATDEIERGRVMVNGQSAKPSREVRVGDTLALRQPPFTRELVVQDLSTVRGPAPVAQRLYEETAASLAERERISQQRRMAPEPADSLEQGRPTKRDRRDLADWNRWSVSVDDVRDNDNSDS